MRASRRQGRRRTQRGVVEEPAQRRVPHRHPGVRARPLDLEQRRLERRRPGLAAAAHHVRKALPVPGARGGVAQLLRAHQQPARQRRVRVEADAQHAERREQRGLRLPSERIVVALVDGGQEVAQLFAFVVALDRLPRREVRQALRREP